MIPERAWTHFLWGAQTVLADVFENNVPNHVYFDKNTNNVICEVFGFYKHDKVKVFFKDNQFVAVDRYKETHIINKPEDLANLNWQMWQRYAPELNPDQSWIPLLLKYDYIKEEIKTTVNYK